MDYCTIKKCFKGSAKGMEVWEEKMKIVEQLAHAEFLLWVANKEGVNNPEGIR